jgi:hypothetical protein
MILEEPPASVTQIGALLAWWPISFLKIEVPNGPWNNVSDSFLSCIKKCVFYHSIRSVKPHHLMINTLYFSFLNFRQLFIKLSPNLGFT